VKSSSLNKRRPLSDWSILPKFDNNVILMKFHPGMSGAIIDWAVAAGHKGIILEGSGLGHVSEAMFPAIERAIKDDVVVGMSSQCLWGRVHMNVYSTGRDLLRIGVIPLGDMLPETALVKMMWAFGNKTNTSEVKAMMTENLAGELSDRRILETVHRE